MQKKRRALLSLLGARAFPALAGQAFGQGPAWPTRHLRFISGGAAGGTSDIVARNLQEPLQSKFGQSVVIENMPGVGGLIGAGNAARATDGHTFFVSNLASNVLSVLLYEKVPFDWHTDLPGVARCCTLPNGLFVRSDTGITSAQQLFDTLRKDPEKRVFSSAAIGTTSHLSCVMLGQRLGIDLLHIPFKGAAGNMLGLLQGDVFFTIENIPTFAALVKEGRLRLLAVSTAERSPNFPDVPTIQESGIENFDVFSWFGISAARSTPRAAIDAVAAEILGQLAEPVMQTRFENLGMTVAGLGPDAYDKFIASEMADWGATVKAAGLKPAK